MAKRANKLPYRANKRCKRANKPHLQGNKYQQTGTSLVKTTKKSNVLIPALDFIDFP